MSKFIPSTRCWSIPWELTSMTADRQSALIICRRREKVSTDSGVVR